MNALRTAAVALGLALALAISAHAQDAAGLEVGKWVSIFNGKDLTGWTPKFKGHEPGVNFNDTFRVEDGVIKVSYDKWDNFNTVFGHLFYKDKLSHYRLKVEYRFTGEQCPGGPQWAFRNSGVMAHGQAPQEMGLDQNFPHSIEVQMLGGFGDGRPRTTGNLCTPGTRVVMEGKLINQHCIKSTSKTYEGDQWVSLELVVRGSGKVEHYINGELVITYDEPQLDNGTLLKEGTISLQAESHPCEFRNIQVMLLDPDDK